MAAGEDALTEEANRHLTPPRGRSNCRHMWAQCRLDQKTADAFREMLVWRTSPSGEAKNPSSEPSVKCTKSEIIS
jgi:hypothetical protein